MVDKLRNIWKHRFLGILVFISLMIATVFIALQQRQLKMETEKQKLISELNHIKDKFQNVLQMDMTAINAMAVLYKQDHNFSHFDSLAKSLLKLNPMAEILQLNINGIISRVYPYEGYEHTIGIDVYKDSLRKAEENYAFEKQIYFAGPRELRQGGIGILGKVPIKINKDTLAVCVVLTQMDKIQKFLNLDKRYEGKYTFWLAKNSELEENKSNKTFLTENISIDSESATGVLIPEGDWTLYISFGENYIPPTLPWMTLLSGFLISILCAYLVYLNIRKPEFLKKVIQEKSDKISEQDRLFKSVVENSSDAIVLIDRNKFVKFQSPSTKRILGYDIEEIRSIDMDLLLHDDTRMENAVEFYRNMKIPGSEWKMLQKIRHKDGHFLWIDASYKNLLHDDKINAILVIYSDVTARINAEEGEKESKQKLQERVKELSTLYKLNKLLQENDISDELVFQQLANFLPLGFQFPEICSCRIRVDTQTYYSTRFSESEFNIMTSFHSMDGKKGAIEIFYQVVEIVDREKPFLDEECDLMNAISEMLTVHFNNKFHQKSFNEAQVRFKSAFENSNIGMVLSTVDGNWFQMNDAYARMLGYEKEELMKLSLDDITHPDEKAENQNYFVNAKRGEAFLQGVQKRYIHKNGSVVWGSVNVSLVRNEKGEVDYLVGQVEDITSKKESDQMFKNLVENSLVGVYIFQDGKFVYVNPRISEYSGYSEEELKNMSLIDLFHPNDKSMVEKVILEREKGILKTTRYEARFLSKNGNVSWLEFFGSTIIFNGKNALIGTIVNITPHKTLEQERQLIIDDLTRRNRDLEQFSYIVSHNVRGPLANILGLSSLAVNDKFDDAVKKKAMEGINTAAKNLDGVLFDLNELLKMRREITEKKDKLGLEEKVIKSIALLKEPISKTKAEIKYDFKASPYVYAIKSYALNIFYNLISNSIKYSKRDVTPLIEIWSEENETDVILHFKDNGIGIDLVKNSNYLYGLYKRFNQDVEGKGMGLFMVKTQIELMGGKVELESSPGNGCHFTLYFPKK